MSIGLDPAGERPQMAGQLNFCVIASLIRCLYHWPWRLNYHRNRYKPSTETDNNNRIVSFKGGQYYMILEVRVQIHLASGTSKKIFSFLLPLSTLWEVVYTIFKTYYCYYNGNYISKTQQRKQICVELDLLIVQLDHTCLGLLIVFFIPPFKFYCHVFNY